MIRSRTRPVIFTQLDHARLAGAFALAWRDRPHLPIESFVAGVALHDRGYGVLDDDDLDNMSEERWLAIQRAGFAPRGENAVVDLVVALHVRRLVGEPRLPDFEQTLPSLLAKARVEEQTAAAADAITEVCDRLALRFCYGEAHSGRARGYSYELDGDGLIRVDPWPFESPKLNGLIGGFQAAGYPQRLEPLVVPYEVSPWV